MQRHVKVAEGGAKCVRAFCPQCGFPVFAMAWIGKTFRIKM